MKNTERHENWLESARDDLEWAIDSFKSEHYAQICFVSQQVGEKAIKALAMARGAEEIRGHSTTKLSQMLNVNSEVERAAKKLDLYYISARYPDAFPDGIPSDYLTKEQAEEAIDLAKIIIKKVEELIAQAK